MLVEVVTAAEIFFERIGVAEVVDDGSVLDFGDCEGSRREFGLESIALFLGLLFGRVERLAGLHDPGLVVEDIVLFDGVGEHCG